MYDNAVFGCGTCYFDYRFCISRLPGNFEVIAQVSSSLPPTSLFQFPASTPLSPVPCPKFPVPILLGLDQRLEALQKWCSC